MNISDTECREIVGRVHPDYRPVWDNSPTRDQVALARYFLPLKSSKDLVEPTRPKAIKWYCPFAAQGKFPSGHRYCINTYVGCEHGCVYCYASGYTKGDATPKDGFVRLINKDMADLETFDVPSAPVHLCNSTDAFQTGMETEHRHTRYALERILANRKRFSTVTILTKNPCLPVHDGYLDLFKELGTLPPGHARHDLFAKHMWPGFQLEVSLALWREEAGAFYDPGAPPLQERRDAVRAITNSGIPVVLRIDPLFPRSPVTRGKCLADFGLPEAQTLDDLRNLVSFAKEIGARHVVYSPLKIIQPRHRPMSDAMTRMKAVYREMSPGKLTWRGGSFRLPGIVAEAEIVEPFLHICRDIGVVAKFCMTSLIETP